jgi:hypothetical protein
LSVVLNFVPPREYIVLAIHLKIESSLIYLMKGRGCGAIH